MAKVDVHPMNMIAECLATWLADCGQWTPTMHRFPREIIPLQDGGSILIGGVILSAMTHTAHLIDNRIAMHETLIVRATAAEPGQLGMEGPELFRLVRNPREPGHYFILQGASSLMSAYFGMISGDLARFGKPSRAAPGRPCRPFIAMPTQSGNGHASEMAICPDCRGYLFPGMIDHPWPVFRSSDMRLIHRAPG